MAIQLEANYSKKLGLPGYSSHQFSVTLRTEIPDLTKVQQESARLYSELQQAVDASIKEVGYLPGENGHANGNANGHKNGNGHTEEWKCSPKQKELIINFVDEHNLEKKDIEKLSTEMFGIGVKALNKLQASGLIDELIKTHGKQSPRQTRPVAGGRR